MIRINRCLSVLLIVVLAVVQLSLLAAPTASEAPALLSPTIALQGWTPPDDPTIMRARPVNVHFDVLSQMAAAASPSIRLDLFDDASLLAVIDRQESGWGGARVWTGRVDGARQSEVTLVFQDDVMSGDIRADGAFYQIRYAEGGLHFAYQIDQQAFPEDAEPLTTDNLPPAPEAGIAGDVMIQDSCTDIDVMVVYTGAARAAAGGTTAMNTLINTAISETNTGYANSGVSQRMDLVYTAEVSYDETNFNWSTALNRLTNKTDGYIDEVHTWRDTYKADAVVLIVDNTDYCGMAWLMTSLSSSFESLAFSLVSRTCATGYYSFAHETGHNFGSHHDRGTAINQTGVYTYSYGYQAPDKAFRTIMAYNCTGGCPRVNHWSNPDVYYGGQPTGVIYTAPNSADNRRSLNNTACTVANWRVASALSAPTGVAASDGTYTDKVRVTWNASAGATSYQVHRATSPTSAKTQLGAPTGTSFDDTTAVGGVTYYYWVKACNGSLCSDFSAPDTGWRPAPSGICVPASPLSCGGSDSRNNGGTGSTDQVDSYSCVSWNETGPEYTYSFRPGASGQVTVTLSNMSQDLDIFVLDGASGSCNAQNCLAYGNTSASFAAQRGRTYYFVVDGYYGAVSNYRIEVRCSLPSGGDDYWVYLPLVGKEN